MMNRYTIKRKIGSGFTLIHVEGLQLKTFDKKGNMKKWKKFKSKSELDTAVYKLLADKNVILV